MCIDLGLFDFDLCRLDYAKVALSNKEREELVRKDCNTFLKTREGLSYLCMKYPRHLLVSEAVNEYIKTALWIDSIV